MPDPVAMTEPSGEYATVLMTSLPRMTPGTQAHLAAGGKDMRFGNKWRQNMGREGGRGGGREEGGGGNWER